MSVLGNHQALSDGFDLVSISEKVACSIYETGNAKQNMNKKDGSVDTK